MHARFKLIAAAALGGLLILAWQPAQAAGPAKQDFALTESVSRARQYDYVGDANSNDCIVLSAETRSASNDCDFPVQVYFSGKQGYVTAHCNAFEK